MAKKHKVTWTREPGGTPFGVKIREMVLFGGDGLSKAAEMLLFQVDRAQHYKDVLKPAIRAGHIVICDRYVDSTMAYQGAGRGWRKADLLNLHRITTGMLLPDLTFVLMGKPHAEMNMADTFEREASDFHARLQAEYERMCAEGGRYVRIDANRPVDVIADEIEAVTLDRLSRRTHS